MASKVGRRFTVTQLERDFEELQQSVQNLNLSPSEVYALYAPIRWRLLKERLLKFRTIVCCLMAVLAIVCCIPSVDWHASAVGRLAMIQLLPYWDWTTLYKAKCLIDRRNVASVKSSTPDFLHDNCAVCENIETVPHRNNISFEYLQVRHLFRSLPLVVNDSHPTWPEQRFTANWTQFLMATEPLLLNNPCNLQTNLVYLTNADKTAALDNIVDVLFHDSDDGGWFLQFRNCDQQSVKRSRVLFRKPYFYAPHLEAPYTSWLLLSKGYNGTTERNLRMVGMIVVMQLKESLNVTLYPRSRCSSYCHRLRMRLSEGQSLVFSTNLWEFAYRPVGGPSTAVTFISETYGV